MRLNFFVCLFRSWTGTIHNQEEKSICSIVRAAALVQRPSMKHFFLSIVPDYCSSCLSPARAYGLYRPPFQQRVLIAGLASGITQFQNAAAKKLYDYPYSGKCIGF